MSELTDDQLDGLFRKSAEEFDPQFDPAAWQDMKSRLDSHDRTRPGGAATWKNLLKWGLPVLFLLLLTGGAWYVYQKTKAVNQPMTFGHKPAPQLPKKKLAENGEQPESPRLAATSSPASPMVVPGKPADDVIERRQEEAERSADRAGLITERSTPKSHPIEAAKKTVTTKADLSKHATKPVSTSYTSVTETRVLTPATRVGKASVIGKTEKSVHRLRKLIGSPTSVSVSGRRRNKRSLTTFSLSNHAITSTPSFTNRRVQKQQKIDLQSTSLTSGEVVGMGVMPDVSKPVFDLNELAIRPARWSQPLSFVGRLVVGIPDTSTQKVVSIPAVPRGLSIRFAVAPDLSTVGLKNFSRPGTNIGLLLEYRLASRWSVQAGVVRSIKVYNATPGQYGYWPDYIKKWATTPTGVEGACTIIDIPINIRYDAIIKPRRDNKLPSRWFISTGVTSYVMKQEDYTFKYTDYTHVYPPMLSESASTGGYGLSHVNISLGYERALNRRLSWQVEPFMKVPLKGVGYFKIDVISTGAFFSIRYKL